MLGKETVLVISDMQMPFEHRDTLPFLRAVKEIYEPTRIVCIGDEIDAHALSFFKKDPDGYSAGHEHKEALTHLRPLYKLFPTADAVYSNHTQRPLRIAFDAGIPLAFMKSVHEFMEAPPGWKWHEFIVIDGVRYEHGDALGGGGATATRKLPVENGQSTVFGHFHAYAGVEWQGNPNVLMFGMNVGCLIDKDAYVFKYWRTPKRPILGCGIVDRGIPTFVPMLLKKGGRWTGDL